MTVVSKSRGMVFAFGTVSFFMADEGKTIRVDVSQDLLARLEGSPPASRDAYLECLVRYRRYFAQIAAAKYDEGNYEPEVNVLVVRISDSDLVGSDRIE